MPSKNKKRSTGRFDLLVWALRTSIRSAVLVDDSADPMTAIKRFDELVKSLGFEPARIAKASEDLCGGKVATRQVKYIHNIKPSCGILFAVIDGKLWVKSRNTAISLETSLINILLQSVGESEFLIDV